ncbi:MAG TPA: hypothetical protein VFO01_13005 [Trebonia sp.]|nr:hypothetical protein [Trebonia sp.]
MQAALEKNTQGLSPLVGSTMTLDAYPLVMDVPVMQRVAVAKYQFGVIKKPYNVTNMIQPEPGEITK